MKQELQYLREELNQRISFHHDHINKTINMVLLVWGGAIAILGTVGIKFVEISIEIKPLYFIEATIFFISNLILYLAARKYHTGIDHIFRIAAYITVFYEKRPSNTVKIGKNFSWEITNFEIEFHTIKNETKRKKGFYKRNDEFKVLILISLVLIIIFSGIFFYTGGTIGIIQIILLLICVFYIAFSLYLSLIVPKYTSSIDNFGMRVRHLNNFFQYALDTEHYTLKEIKDRFGNFYEICKQYLHNSTGSEEATVTKNS